MNSSTTQLPGNFISDDIFQLNSIGINIAAANNEIPFELFTTDALRNLCQGEKNIWMRSSRLFMGSQVFSEIDLFSRDFQG